MTGDAVVRPRARCSAPGRSGSQWGGGDQVAPAPLECQNNSPAGPYRQYGKNTYHQTPSGNAETTIRKDSLGTPSIQRSASCSGTRTSRRAVPSWATPPLPEHS